MIPVPKLLQNLFKSALIVAALSSTGVAQKFEGLALTPPMGWNSWNTFYLKIDEELIRGVADAMVENGMRDAGYNYIVLDDGWMASERDADGNLVPDPEKFPSGLKALGDYLHERGFKFGIYNCAGSKTCGGYPGSMGHEYQDARSYASWGVDYLKYDWCNTGTRDAREAYTTMRDALYAAGRPVVFSICEWGMNEPWKWAKDVGHLWRTTGDIIDCYDCTNDYSIGWKKILDLQRSQGPSPHLGLEPFAGPDHWNDPDMMEVGNEGLTLAESRAHFSLWCILAAPLMAGNDVRNMEEAIISILTNKEAIAINQDAKGKQGKRIYQDPRKEIWIRELSDGDWAVAVLNASDNPQEVSVNWRDIQIPRDTFEIRDIWNAEDLGTTDTVPSVSQTIEAHDVMFFRLSRVAK